ncbi:MAG: arginine--tRNA ligase [Ignavibacteria bacterium]|nr:arginine--tRNA ligase [Ignavibacteria bacterium]
MKQFVHNLCSPVIENLFPGAAYSLSFDTPQHEGHGDLSTNVALTLTKQVKMPPRDVAKRIIDALPVNPAEIEKVEIAGPGFINFFFTPAFIASVIPQIFQEENSFGRSAKYSGKKANVEFVSANPTGPLTVGHGRNAVCGDTVATMLEWIGYSVDREYYFNNAGRQMRVLGDSVRHRYLQALGKDIAFPEDYYQGEYITDLAKTLVAEYGDKLQDEPAEGIFKDRAEQAMFQDIKQTLERMGIRHSVFYNEHSLYEEGKITALLQIFKDKGLSYEKDNALWLKLSDLGNEQDKVIIKSTGEPTYRLPDIAYHITKFERNYDKIVDIFGSDHNATYPDVLAALKSMGYPTESIAVLIHQFVTIIQGGEIVKMSTRKANYITLDELIDETSADVVRFFFSMRSISSHMNFDIDLAKKQSDENPVFYLQYAHARICSILRVAGEQGLNSSLDHLENLTAPEELKLLKKLHGFPEIVLYAAENFEAHKLAMYLMELAEAFHRFYTVCRIIGSDPAIASSRLALAIATRTVLRNGLSILGVSAPERM